MDRMLLKRFFKACSLLLLLVISGCTFLSLLDKESPEEAVMVEQEVRSRWEQRKIELNKEYIGMTKEEVRKEWGKPEHIDFNESYCGKVNDDCDWGNKKNNPDIKIADERWNYFKKFKSKTGTYWHTVNFYFVDDEVVKVR